MNDANPRQQIVDSIKNNNNVLVTVSTNPSVDELSAALGLTILLNNLGKRGTAVVSGEIPPAINFLEPGKTFEHTTDSLRDFIIALDKEKADHLRYKVDGDVVKIFITPYRTQLSEKDLQFSLGDYNVEVVVALGVKDQEHLDKALDAHGAILHDAAVVTLTAGKDASSLGSINWQDQSASSLCEMLVSLSEALKEEKPLLDEQTATAFLTGIVSATDRFSNDHTTSRVMTMAAQLMAAGANQQLIAAKLAEAHAIGPNAQLNTAIGQSPQNPDGTMSLAEGAEPMRLSRDRKKGKKPKKPEDGLVIEIDHPEEPAFAEQSMPTLQPPIEEEMNIVEPAETAEQTLARELAEVIPPVPEKPVEDLGQELNNAAEAQPQSEEPELPRIEPGPQVDAPTEPLGELPKLDFEALLPKTQTPQVPASEPQPELQLPPLPPFPGESLPSAPNTDISKHDNGDNYVSGQPSSAPAITGSGQSDPGVAPIDPFAAPLSPTLPPLQPDPLFANQHTSDMAPVGQTITPPHAPDEIEYEESPILNDPAAVAAVPDFAAMSPTGLAASTPPPPMDPPSLDSLPPLPPLPDFSATPPPPPDLSLPSINTPSVPPVAPAPVEPPAGDAPPPPPGQFKIPGQ